MFWWSTIDKYWALTRSRQSARRAWRQMLAAYVVTHARAVAICFSRRVAGRATGNEEAEGVGGSCGSRRRGSRFS
eukprot:1510366-Pleurochrysis_carterae.AAC.1